MLALCIGRYPVAPSELLHFFASGLGIAELLGLPALDETRYQLLHQLIIEIRLPRVLAAALVGSALAVSGAAYQAMFRNPLVSPGILGVLAGAAAGAGVALLFQASWISVQLSAFFGGLLAVGLGLTLAFLFGRGSIILLLLGGLLSGALFTSILSLVKYAADPHNQLPSLVYWLMGSLSNAELDQVLSLTPIILLGIIGLSLLGRGLDAMAMGEEEAASLGINLTRLRLLVIGLATLISALTVSLAGIIGWVGLIIPHLARGLIGPANSYLLPLSGILGAAFLLLADSLARSLFIAEIPLGLVTELLGLPVFLLVLAKARKGWN